VATNCSRFEATPAVASMFGEGIKIGGATWTFCMCRELLSMILSGSSLYRYRGYAYLSFVEIYFSFYHEWTTKMLSLMRKVLSLSTLERG
jgi:hypothetical protein